MQEMSSINFVFSQKTPSSLVFEGEELCTLIHPPRHREHPERQTDRGHYGETTKSIRRSVWCETSLMTYEEYIREQQTTFDEEHSDECCFVDNQAEGVFVRGH